MTLYLIRHATPVMEEADPERPLSDFGRLEASALAQGLSQHKPSVIYHSGKLRSKETAEAIAKTTGASVEQADGLKPNDDPSPWAERINYSDEDLMIVGHLPFLDKLLWLLIKNDPQEMLVKFEPATAAVIEKTDEGWKLKGTFTP